MVIKINSTKNYIMKSRYHLYWVKSMLKKQMKISKLSILGHISIGSYLRYRDMRLGVLSHQGYQTIFLWNSRCSGSQWFDHVGYSPCHDLWPHWWEYREFSVCVWSNELYRQAVQWIGRLTYTEQASVHVSWQHTFSKIFAQF